MTGKTQIARVKLPFPHLGQQAVIRSKKRHNWLSAGRRWRKTSMLATVIMVESAIEVKGDYMWGAPTFDQVRIGMTEAKKACGGIADFNLSRMVATLPNGSRIFYRSLDDPDNARGYTLTGVGIDECADIKPEAWYEVLRPTLIDTKGWSWAIGTPKGRNWFFIEHTAAQSRDESTSWQAPTVGCRIENGELIRAPHPLENPFVEFAEIKNLWLTMPERTFRQEILAEFIEGEGAVFRNIPACMNAPKTTPAAHAGHRIVAGCDWAKQHDYTTFSFGCLDCKQEVDRDRFNKIDYAFQVERLQALCKQWQPSAIQTELNSIGQPVFEQLQRLGLPVVGFETTASTKPPLIENLALALERAEWQFQQDVIWTAELEAYERKVSTVTGRSSYSAPDGVHDDTVMARALMLWNANTPLAIPFVQGKAQGWNPR